MRPLKKTTPETALKRQCLQYLSYKYGRRFWYVNVIGGLGIRPGTPDTLACLKDGKGPGIFVAIEFKRPGGRLSEYQKVAIDNIREAGGLAFVIDSIEKCIAEFKRFDGNQGEIF